MKFHAIAIGLVGLLASDLRAQTNATINSDKVGYSLGFKVGANWKNNEMQDVVLDSVLQGIRDALAGKSPKFTQDEMNAQLGLYQAELQQRVAVQRQAQADRNKADGEKFLAANKSSPGVVVLPSGLQYKVIQPGTESKPAPSDVVVVHYRGFYLNGTEFDSSYSRGAPVSVTMGSVMKGMAEGLQLMGIGAKWQLFVPAELAYGTSGFPQYKVGPNEALIFEIELMEIQHATGPVAAAPSATSDIVRVPSAEEMAHGAQIEVIKQDGSPPQPVPQK